MNIRQQLNPKTNAIIDAATETDIHLCKVLPEQLTIFKIPSYFVLQSDKKAASLRNLTIKQNNSKVLQKSASKLRDTLMWWAKCSKMKVQILPDKLLPVKYRLNFITLTLPSEQRHSDTQIKKVCLNQFLTELRTKHNVHRYVWKAELQGNGNIHFHIVTDVFLHHSIIREIWNRCVEKLGYVSEFETRNHHKNPNSIDIKTVRNFQGCAKYISKYIGKDIDLTNFKCTAVLKWRREMYVKQCIKNNINPDENPNEISIQGRKVAISESLVIPTNKTEIAEGSTATEIDRLINSDNTTFFSSDVVTVVKWKNLNELKIHCPRLYSTYKAIMQDYLSILN